VLELELLLAARFVEELAEADGGELRLGLPELGDRVRATMHAAERGLTAPARADEAVLVAAQHDERTIAHGRSGTRRRTRALVLGPHEGDRGREGDEDGGDRGSQGS